MNDMESLPNEGDICIVQLSEKYNEDGQLNLEHLAVASYNKSGFDPVGVQFTGYGPGDMVFDGKIVGWQKVNDLFK